MTSQNDDAQNSLVAEYAEVNSNFRTLAEIRFKLLALVPTLGGVAVYLLSTLQGERAAGPLGYGLVLLISTLGFMATLGVTFYDQRNSQIYDALISRARLLEAKLKLPPASDGAAKSYGGQFSDRPGRGRKLLGVLTVGHDTGLSLIYGSVLGAWFLPLVASALTVLGCCLTTRFRISLATAFVMVALFTLDLLRLDGVFRRLMRH